MRRRWPRGKTPSWLDVRHGALSPVPGAAQALPRLCPLPAQLGLCHPRGNCPRAGWAALQPLRASPSRGSVPAPCTGLAGAGGRSELVCGSCPFARAPSQIRDWRGSVGPGLVAAAVSPPRRGSRTPPLARCCLRRGAAGAVPAVLEIMEFVPTGIISGVALPIQPGGPERPGSLRPLWPPVHCPHALSCPREKPEHVQVALPAPVSPSQLGTCGSCCPGFAQPTPGGARLSSGQSSPLSPTRLQAQGSCHQEQPQDVLLVGTGGKPTPARCAPRAQALGVSGARPGAWGPHGGGVGSAQPGAKALGNKEEMELESFPDPAGACPGGRVTHPDPAPLPRRPPDPAGGDCTQPDWGWEPSAHRGGSEGPS